MSAAVTERTTVRLPDDLLRRARKKAAADDRTLTSMIEEGLRLVLAGERPPAPAAARYARVSRETGGPAAGVDFPRMRDIDEQDDVERLARLKSQTGGSEN
jgi:plasmid stability protein